MLPIINIIIAAGLISFTSWLSNKKPELAGFLIALPTSSMIVIALSYIQYHDQKSTTLFAKSIFAAIPLSLLFFVPFLLAEKLPLPFWGIYALGFLFLIAGYFIHHSIVNLLD